MAPLPPRTTAPAEAKARRARSKVSAAPRDALCSTQTTGAAATARRSLYNKLAVAASSDEDEDAHRAEVLSLSLGNAMRGVADEHLSNDGLNHGVRKRLANGGEVLKDFIASAKCAPGACDSKKYDVQKPATPPKKAWNDTFGVSPFSAYLETILDYNADRSPAGKGYYNAFVGGKIDVRAWTLSYTVAST